MKRTIYILCLIAVITATGATLKQQEHPPTSNAPPLAQAQATTVFNAEEEQQQGPRVESYTPAGESTSPAQNKALVGEEIAEIGTLNGSFSDPSPNEISPTQPTEKAEPTNTTTAPTQTATKPSNPTTVESTTPKNGDKRTVDGENQIFVLGFGWITDSGGGGCGEISDGKGSIDVMVGNMGGESTQAKKSTTPYIPAPGEIVQELIPAPTKNSTPPDYKPNIPIPENPRQSQLDPNHANFDKIIGH